MIGRIFFLMVAGATGGLIAWALTEPGAPKNIFDDAAWSVFQRNFAMAAGSMIGGLVGLTSGLYQGSKRHAINGLVAGAVLGLLVGPVGVNLGSAVYNAVAGPARGVAGVGFVVDAAARSVGWAIFGAFLGCAEGAVGRSFKRAIQGSIGGLIGGAIGGIGFVLASQVMAAMATPGAGTQEVGIAGRAVGLICLGGGIGLMIGLVESVARRAWIRLELGRNEGKEWSLDNPTTVIGRSELAHVPLMGDSAVAPEHACIQAHRGQYYLRDLGSPGGITLNGQRVSESMLTSGDSITIGSFRLTFLLKGGQSPRVSAPMAARPVEMTNQVAPVGVSSATVQMPAQTSAPALVALNGPLAGQRFPVNTALELGRESVSVPLGFDSMASRRHAAVTPSSMGIEVVDLGSTNGTLVNGSKIQAALIRVGDQLQIGSTIFRVES